MRCSGVEDRRIQGYFTGTAELRGRSVKNLNSTLMRGDVREVPELAKKLARRIKKLEEQIEELQRFEGLPGDKVEPWASLFASVDGAEVGEEHLEAARAFVAYCLARGKQPTWVCLLEWADSFDEEEDE